MPSFRNLGHPEQIVCFVPFGQNPEWSAAPPGASGEGHLVFGGGPWKAAGMESWVLDDSIIHSAVSEYSSRAAVEAFWGENWGMDDLEDSVVGELTGIVGFMSDGQPLVGGAEGEAGLSIC